jgi:ribosomal protein S18 acetylase RimI-like enzyme
MPNKAMHRSASRPVIFDVGQKIMITIKSCTGPSEYKVIRSEALQSDPDAFGELYEKFTLKSNNEIELYLNDVNNGVSKRIDLMHSNNKIIGMCGYGIGENDLGFIWGVYINSDFRGNGLAIKLLNSCTENLWKMGCKTIKAKVAAPNMRAINFYKKLGFKISEPVGTLRLGSSIPVYEISKSAQPDDAPEPATNADSALPSSHPPAR